MKWCKGSVLTLFCSVIILPCAKEKQCPGGKTSCSDDSTCCPLHSGNFGCCPFQNAICCRDGIHCCPSGYTCDVRNSICNLDVKSIPCVSTIPVTLNSIAEGNVVGSGGEKECPPDYFLCGFGRRRSGFQCCPNWEPFPPAVFTYSAAKVVKCNHEFACPDRYTCCEADKSYLCCPMPQAVCCYDHMLCCPKGFKCSPDEKTCSSGVLTVPALSALSPMSLKKGFNRLLESPSVGGTKLTVLKTSKMFHSIVCPDGECECQSDHTCCELSSGRWGCCPLPNALCCDDGVHCCPEGSIYFPSAGICLKEIERTPFSIYYGGSCCQPHAGQFYCCDLRDAACCHDGGHSCCPNGYTCIAHGNCIKQSKGVAILERIPASMQKADVGSVICPDGQSECPYTYTCCKLSSGQYGCCPLPDAVCCSDGALCCPYGYSCDVPAGTCQHQRETKVGDYDGLL